MYPHKLPCLGLLLALGLLPSARAELNWTNRISLSARMGFNFNATFTGLENLPVPHLPRLTPDGVAYNYDNGYVLPDSSGGQGGQTWNWGYDSSAAQVSGNNILISRNTGTALSPKVEMEDDPSWGGELVYELLIPYERGTCFGLQLAGNFQSLSLSDDSSASTGVRRLTYPFAYTPGTKPPTATVGNPYRGTFDGPGFTISDTPGSPVATVLPDAAAVSGRRKVEGDLWGLRVGPVLQVPLGDGLDVALYGGLAVGYLDAQASWRETVSMGGVSAEPVAGQGSDTAALFGFYGGATVYYQFASHWSVQAGAYYQSLEDYEETFSGRKVELDFSDNIFVTFGVGFTF